MKLRLFLCISPFSIILVYTGVIFAYPVWSHEIGMDLWNYNDEERLLIETEQQNRDLQLKSDKVVDRIWLKTAIVGQLIVGEANLADAVEQVYESYQGDPKALTKIKELFPSTSDRMSIALQLIDQVTKEKDFDRAQIEKAVLRLKKDLSEI